MQMSVAEEKDRLQRLYLALEGALEQLSYAQQIAAQGGSIERPGDDVQHIERLFGELNLVRNGVRDRLMKVLSRPTLGVVK